MPLSGVFRTYLPPFYIKNANFMNDLLFLSKSAWNALKRDLRSGQLKMLLLSASLGVAALSSVGFLSSRLENGLERDASHLLGGDAVVTSSFETPPDIVSQAQSLHLRVTQTMSFPSMVRVAQNVTKPDKSVYGNESFGQTRLASLKVVQDNYPLTGELKVLRDQGEVQSIPANLSTTLTPKLTSDFNAAKTKDSAHANAYANKSPRQPDTVTALVSDFQKLKTTDTPSVAVKEAPHRGEVWVEAGLLEALDASLGDTLLIGKAALRVTHVLTFEPDKGAGFMSFAPRVLMNRGDLAATQLVQPSSRIGWRFAVVGEPQAVRAWSDWVQNKIDSSANRGVRLETLASGRPEIRQTLDRASKFLRLVALLSVILSAIAVALSARQFSQQHLQDCAMRRVFGQSQRAISSMFAIEFTLLAGLSSTVGLVIGYAVHLLFVHLLSSLVDTQLPQPSYYAVFEGLGVGFCTMLAFGLSPVVQLASVSPVKVLRSEFGGAKKLPFIIWTSAGVGLCILMAFVSNDFFLTVYVVSSFLGAIVFFALLGFATLRFLRRLVDEQTSPVWLRIATRQMNARMAYSVLQISALSVGLLALMLLTLLRTDLISSWREATPQDAPNRFVINIQSDQAMSFEDYLKSGGVKEFDWYPMIKGRLIAINSEEVTANRYSDERAQHMVDREFNITHSAQVPANNKIVQGRWIPNERESLSIEEGIAKTLNLHLGDRLRFDISGIIYDAQITSVRKVDWGSMRTNFFIVLPLEQMNDMPHSFIAAFHAPGVKGFDRDLVNQFPNVTDIDVASTLKQIEDILNQVVAAVEFLFVFTLITGLVVLVACIHNTREQRAKEYALLKAMGAGQGLLVKIQRAELWGMGTLAGLMSSLCASAIGWGLAIYVFDFQWHGSVLFVLLGTGFGLLVAWGAGWYGLRNVLRLSVVKVLRRI
jgi:putative ABC transport system permease protein